MTDYKPNSRRSKAEAELATTDEKKVQKVVSGNARTRENNTRRLTSLFVSEDASNVKSYVLMDVLVPTIKKAISDIVVNGMDMILYGETRNRSDSRSGRVSYRSYYEEPRRSDSRSGRSNSGRFDYEDIIFDKRGDAELVKTQMLDILDQYGIVTIADMYDLAGLTAPYTAAKYGWSSMRTAEVMHVRDGYVIKLPKAIPID